MIWKWGKLPMTKLYDTKWCDFYIYYDKFLNLFFMISVKEFKSGYFSAGKQVASRLIADLLWIKGNKKLFIQFK